MPAPVTPRLRGYRARRFNMRHRGRRGKSELDCEAGARGKAEWRCNINKHSGPGKTPWGCTTNDLYEGACTSAEPPWNDRDMWEAGGANTQYNCERSWRVGHPAGSLEKSDKLDFTAMFKGVSGSKSSTVTSTYQLTGMAGWLNTCLGVGNDLDAGCGAAANKCFDANACEGDER